MSIRLTAVAWGMLAACTVDPISPAGRPCSPASPCGPDAICDPARGRCVPASLDRGAPREARGEDATLPPDLGSDRPRPHDGGLTLCGLVFVDVTKDPEHCGACGKACTAPASDRCVDKACVCGATGAACPAGTTCVGGVCDPNPCLGKSDGTACDDKLYCTVSDACQGGLCVGKPRDCGGPAPCLTASCDETIDQCVTKPQSDGTPCAGGQCYAGSCCTGCWTGTSCVAGKEASACGDSGDLCQSCATTECRSLPGSCGWLLDKCNTLLAKADGTACPGGACRDGACCKGCWDGDGCRLGTHPSACGPVGGLCKDCTGECRTGSTCTNGTCSDPPKPDGTACAAGAGKCLAGGCCTGCVENNLCYSGTTVSRCGTGATSCKACPAPSLECHVATCLKGVCGTASASNGTSCAGGTCLNGSCCKGCVSGSSCLPGTSPSACGKGGSACVSCSSATPTCDAGSCV